MSRPTPQEIERIARAALAEDGAGVDATVAFLSLADTPVAADIVAGQDAVLAGLDVARAVFAATETGVRFETDHHDGDRLRAGDVVCRVEGPAGGVLAAERVALNFLQRLCGTATLAARFVDRVRAHGITILDTRKTTPMLRDLEKYAVRCGGAQNHRRDLGAMVLVKENHVRALGGEATLADMLRARSTSDDAFVEVEVDSLAFLGELLGARVDRVMLDNFSPDQVREALAAIAAYQASHEGYSVEVEVSGGITLENIDDYAIDGVDFISVGALTHSAPAISMSLEVR